MRRTLTTVALACMLLAGCGGDSDDAGTAGDTTTAPTGSATPGSVDTNFTGKGSDRFCELARSFGERLNKLGTADPTQVKVLVTEAEGATKELLAAAPAEIKGDAQVVAAASSNFYQVLAQANYDLTKVPPDALSGLQKPEVQASTRRLGAYSEKVCGVTTSVP